jgi:hypothetical protein
MLAINDFLLLWSPDDPPLNSGTILNPDSWQKIRKTAAKRLQKIMYDGHRLRVERSADRVRLITSGRLCAFDLFAMDGDDSQDQPLSTQKDNLKRFLARRPKGIFVASFEEIDPDLLRKAGELRWGIAQEL